MFSVILIKLLTAANTPRIQGSRIQGSLIKEDLRWRWVAEQLAEEESAGQSCVKGLLIQCIEENQLSHQLMFADFQIS